MLISLRFMETHGVALGYWGDKIRNILIIRVRFTTEFFFEHGFIGLTRMLRSWRYCLPDSSHYKSWKSRDFVPGYSRFARYWLPAKSTIYATKQPKTDTYFFIFLFIDIFSSVQSAIRVRFTTEFFFRTRIYWIDADASLLVVLSSRLNKVISNRE